MEKAYEHKGIEEKWLSYWMRSNLFIANNEFEGKRFSIVIPPPNITGALHMGHALQYTLHDLYTRWKRMKGYMALWVPGMDHAGIATQYVVEKELAKENLFREILGREEFLKRVWEWKEKAIEKIKYQLMKLGSSCDWSRQRFTLDEGLSEAVSEAFVRLYRENLIYRAEYIINWCPRCLTALSDLETVHKEYRGKLYYIRYPMKLGDGYIEVATTRPETMLGDTAVAINPKDERYHGYEGKYLILPLVKRTIPIIADEAVMISFGTGAVKITPSHDPDDFQIAKRHNLPGINVMTADGKMNKEAQQYEGLDRFECRIKILEDLRAEGLLSKEEDYNYSIGHCYRCDTIIEPRISTQWFVYMKPLAEPAMKAVEEGRIRLIPENWDKVYFDWMNNIKDWCISRQIWWGHRIPAFHCLNCNFVNVDVSKPERCRNCNSMELIQDSDVLDTWFSSALWPFSVFGWPKETKDLKAFYPTDLLITGFDILFFWVARMIVMGLKFMNDVPFKKVFLTGLIRDEAGQKMSKTKGNIIDPLEIIESMGADSLRFTLISQTTAGNDVSISKSKIYGNRTFMNKLWNATRFVLMHIPDNFQIAKFDKENLSLFDKWILTRINEVIKEVNEALENYNVSEACYSLYHFVWNEYCDWYIEFSKPYLSSGNEERIKITLTVLITILDKVLKLLHPFIPFITEELWQNLKFVKKEKESLALASYPEYHPEEIFKDSKEPVLFLRNLISQIRQIRAEMNVAPQKKIDCYLIPKSDSEDKVCKNYSEQIIFLTNLNQLAIIKEFPKDAVLIKDSLANIEIGVDLLGSINIGKETERINKEIIKLEKTKKELSEKLYDKNIIEKAPKEIIEGYKIRLEETKIRLNRLSCHLNDLKKMKN